MVRSALWDTSDDLWRQADTAERELLGALRRLRDVSPFEYRGRHRPPEPDEDDGGVS